MYKNFVYKNLVAIGLTSHTGHYAEDVIVDGKDTKLGINNCAFESTANEGLDIGNKRSGETIGIERAVLNQGVGIANLELEGGGVNTREVGTARRLVLLRLEGERVHVDSGRTRNVAVVLVGLHQVEVASLADRESIVSVELKLHCRSRVARKQRTTVLVVERTQNIREVRPLVVGKNTLEVINITGGNQVVVLHNPDQLLHRVVEVQTNSVVGGGQSLLTCELQLLNQVLVRDLGEATTLISVKVDVVNIQSSTSQTQVG